MSVRAARAVRGTAILRGAAALSLAACLVTLAGTIQPIAPSAPPPVLLTAAATSATVFTVTLATDAGDDLPGDGICAVAPDDRRCSIRAAVQEANARPAEGPYVVILPAGTYSLTIPGDSENDAQRGDVDIRASIDLLGAGQDVTTIHGPAEQLDHALEVFPPAVARLRGLTIQGGLGGGIQNRGGRLDVADCAIRGNRAFFGGGIANDGVLTLTHSVVADNVGGQGGGIIVFGDSLATIRHSRIEGNGDAQGGGIKVVNGSLDLADSTVTGNLGGHGGGLNLIGDLPITIQRSTIAHNHASLHPDPPWHGYGGGIWNQATRVRLDNVTLSDNWGQGGGIFNVGHITVTNSTIAHNGTFSWGAAISNAGTFWVANTLIGPTGQGANCDSSRTWLTSGGHNLDSDGSCMLRAEGDRYGLDPRLGPLADNGGATWTHALLPGSPAIDAADRALCPPTDQRGAARPAGAGCDIGAYEYGAAAPTATPPTSRTPAYLPRLLRQAGDDRGVTLGRWRRQRAMEFTTETQRLQSKPFSVSPCLCGRFWS